MSVTIEYSDTRTIQKVSFAWVSDACGDATGTTRKLSGIIERVVFDPGPAEPSAAYDVTLLDEQDVDVLAGQGANLNATATTAVAPGVPLKDGTTTAITAPAIDDELTLVVEAAGDTKSGSVHVYILRVFSDQQPG